MVHSKTHAVQSNCVAMSQDFLLLPRHMLAAICTLLLLPQCATISDQQRRYEDGAAGNQRSIMRKELTLADPGKPAGEASAIGFDSALESANFVSGSHGEEDLELAIPLIGSSPPRPRATHRRKSTYRLRGVTNPSFVVIPEQDQIWLVARKIVVGQDPEDPDSDWVNEVLMGNVKLSTFRERKSENPNEPFKMSWNKFGMAVDIRLHGPERQGMVECELHKNHFGPEDPRVFQHAGKIYLLVVGTDVIDPSTGRMPENSLLRPQCQAPHEGVRLHLAEVTFDHGGFEFGPTAKLHFKDWTMHRIERAWSMFSYEPLGKQAKLYGVYSIHPHLIVNVDPSSGECKGSFKENSPFIEELAQKLKVNATEFRGGSGVARISGFERKPYYLAVLHMSWFSGDCPHCALVNKVKHYAHFAYKFSTQPPFKILDVSKVRLPLSSREFKTTADSGGSSRLTYFNGVNYVSSVLFDDNNVVIGYGEADKTSRIYRQNIDDFEEQFFPEQPEPQNTNDS